MKERHRNCKFPVLGEVHEDRNHPAVVSGNAAIVPEEYFRIADKRRLIDLVINECVAAIDAPGQFEFRLRALGVAAIDPVYARGA